MNLNRLREIRKDADKKQREVAEILGITRQQYSLYETGNKPLSIEHLIKLCKFYNVSANYILELPEGLPYPER